MFSKSVNLVNDKTVHISTKGLCDCFYVVRNGKMYHAREFEEGLLSSFKFNAVGNGLFEIFCKHPFELKCEPVEKYDLSNFKLPEKERDFSKPYKVVHNFDLRMTPARIDLLTGVIETGEKFNKLNEQQQRFILLHEIAHFYYKTEYKCDLFAMFNMLKQGYNKSQCYNALKDVLRRTPQNEERIRIIFDNLNVIPIK